MSDTILAVDLGRYKSVACPYDRRTRAHTFRTIDTTPEDVARLDRPAPRSDGRGRGVSERRVGPRPRRRRACREGCQHGGRGLEVQAREAEDGPGRRPPAGPSVRPRPVSRGSRPGEEKRMREGVLAVERLTEPCHWRFRGHRWECGERREVRDDYTRPGDRGTVGRPDVPAGQRDRIRHAARRLRLRARRASHRLED